MGARSLLKVYKLTILNTVYSEQGLEKISSKDYLQKGLTNAQNKLDGESFAIDLFNKKSQSGGIVNKKSQKEVRAMAMPAPGSRS